MGEEEFRRIGKIFLLPTDIGLTSVTSVTSEESESVAELPSSFKSLPLNSAAQTAVSRSKASFSSSGPILEKLNLFLSRSG